MTFLVSMVVLCLNTILINIHFDILNSNMKLTCHTARVWQTHRSSYFLYLLTPYLCPYLLQCWQSLFFCLSSPVETSEKDTAQYLRIQKCSNHNPLESLEDSDPPPPPVYYFFFCLLLQKFGVLWFCRGSCCFCSHMLQDLHFPWFYTVSWLRESLRGERLLSMLLLLRCKHKDGGLGCREPGLIFVDYT